MGKNYIHLHTHSDLSLKDGAQTIKQIVSKAKKLGMPAVALTDHGSAAGLLSLWEECKKAEIKPLLGNEFYVAPTSRLIHKQLDNYKRAYHLTVLAKNNEGLKNIFRLTSRSWQEGLFGGRPRIDEELLKEYSDGLLVLSGCSSGKLSTFLMEERWEEAKENLEFLKDTFKDDFYIEMQNHGIHWQPKLNTLLATIAEKYSLPIVATQDSHYQEKEDADLHANIVSLSMGDMRFETDQVWFKTREEMEKMFPDNFAPLDITNDIADKCNVNWDYSKTIWPVYDLPEERTPQDELRELTYKGFQRLFPNPTQEYKDRLEYELETIVDMGFSTYFLIVQDFINWSETQGMIASPGRGSSASSLVCYSLGITRIDPIRYKLPFSRFLGKHRISLPDVDVDIDKSKRNQVLTYVSEKYGADKFAQIATYSEFKPKGSLRSFARTNKYSPSVGDYLAKMVPAAIAGKEQKWSDIKNINPELFKTDYPEVISLAQKAEGLKFQVGLHAAGVVIADKPINEVVPLFIGKGGETAAQFDKKEVEKIGLVKFDFLGLKTLTVLRDTVELIEKRTKVKISLHDIEDGDKEAYKLFQTGDLDGIFQFETSSAFKDFCIRVRPTKLEDLSIITAVQRPGPMSMKVHEMYVERKQGKEYEVSIPKLKDVLSDTLGLIIFQEDVIRICVELAGYTDGEGDLMRRAIGKKDEVLMAAEKEKFINGCVNNNIDKNKAEELFKDIEGFAAYGFCLGHAASYSRLSYFCAWLKAHYQLEFYTSLLNNSLDNQNDLIKYITSAREHEISISLPNINLANNRFELDNNTIVFPLSSIKGIGTKASDAIIAKRKEVNYFKSLEEFIKSKPNSKALIALAEAGALDELLEI